MVVSEEENCIEESCKAQHADLPEEGWEDAGCCGDDEPKETVSPDAQRLYKIIITARIGRSPFIILTMKPRAKGISRLSVKTTVNARAT